MKKNFIVLISLVVILALKLMAQASDDVESCDYKRYGLDASKFFVYLTQDTPYAQWQVWPDGAKLRPVKATSREDSPHGPIITTYLNPVASRSIREKTGMALGSVIVAENYDAGKKLKDLTVMIRIKDYNPEAGDWHWFRYAPDGTVQATGKVDACIQCHAAKKDNDFIMTAPVK